MEEMERKLLTEEEMERKVKEQVAAIVAKLPPVTGLS